MQLGNAFTALRRYPALAFGDLWRRRIVNKEMSVIDFIVCSTAIWKDCQITRMYSLQCHALTLPKAIRFHGEASVKSYWHFFF